MSTQFKFQVDTTPVPSATGSLCWLARQPSGQVGRKGMRLVASLGVFQTTEKTPGVTSVNLNNEGANRCASTS